MSYAALPTLRTPRLTLRPLTEQDADAMADGVGNFDVSKWLGVVPYPYTRGDALDFIGKVQAAGEPVWGVHDADGLVGTVSTTHELGYWIARRAWRNGYGFEAAHAAVAHWFADPAKGDLASGHFFGNERSRAVLKALGFEEVAQRTRFAKSLNQDVTSHEMTLTRAAWEARQIFVVRTPRLVLRPWTIADAPALAALVTDDVARMTGSMAAGWSVDEAQAYIAARQWRGWPGFMLAIERHGTMIGAIGCGGVPVSLMYVLGAAHWGRGFASESVEAFLRAAFQRFPINRVHADCFEDNPASINVLHKTGFVETGQRTGDSKARLEPASVITYALSRDNLRASQ